MRVVLLGVALATFVIYSRTDDVWCNVCPGAPTTEDKNTSCACENAFYDPSTGTCVRYLSCPIFKPLLSTTVNALASAGVKPLTSSFVTRAVTHLAEGTLDFLLPNVTSTMERLARTILQSSHDLDIMNSIVKKRLVKESNNITSGFKDIISNPFLLRNNKLLRLCQNNTMCVVQKIIEKNVKKSQNTTATVVKEIVDQLILSLDDIRDYAMTNCTEGECPLMSFILKYQDVVIRILVSFKQRNQYLGTLLVKSLINMEPVENEAFDKILSNIGAGT